MATEAAAVQGTSGVVDVAAATGVAADTEAAVTVAVAAATVVAAATAAVDTEAVVTVVVEAATVEDPRGFEESVVDSVKDSVDDSVEEAVGFDERQRGKGNSDHVPWVGLNYYGETYSRSRR